MSERTSFLFMLNMDFMNKEEFDMFEPFDLPARVIAYREAGHTRDDARRLAHIDMQDAAEQTLRDDTANPVSVEIMELSQPPMETAQEEIALEKHQTAYELAAVVGACREHGMGMSDIQYRLAAAIQNNLNCRYVGEQVMVKMESIHANGISERDLILHFEDGVGQTLKNIWQKIRNSFINTFNRIKTWYIKAFDGTQRLGNKAKAVKTTAEGKQGTINNQSFDMGGLKTLAINGKAPEPAQITQSVQTMSAITQNVLGKNASYYNKITETMVEAVKKLSETAQAQAPAQGQQGNNTTNAPAPTNNQPDDFSVGNNSNSVFGSVQGEFKNLTDSFNGLLEDWSGAAQDERFKDLAANQGIPVKIQKTKDPLPGDKMFVVSLPDPQAAMTAKDLTALKLAFGGTVESINPKPREMDDSGNFRTLNTNQIVSICDQVMDACKAGLDYKLLFNERDKAFQNLGKELDRAVNEADKLQGQALTYVKGNVSAATAIFNKINNSEGKWFRYAMGVFSKAVDYCQGSLNQMA